VAGSIVDRMAMPTLSTFLLRRGELVNSLAERAVLRSTGTRALAAALASTGSELADLSADDVAAGIVRLAAADAVAETGAELALSGLDLQLRGAEELDLAAELGEAAREMGTAAEETTRA
jgi:hypothetical protein